MDFQGVCFLQSSWSLADFRNLVTLESGGPGGQKNGRTRAAFLGAAAGSPGEFT